MPVDSQECKLYIFYELHGGQLLVAFGGTWLESLPTDKVYGIPLGEGNDAQQHEALFDFNKMNMEMRPLAYYAHSSMRQGRVTILIRLCKYLEELCRINGQAEKFVFVSPTLISPVRTDTKDTGMRERADLLVGFLHDAPKGRLYLVPHNRGRHWVLGVIDLWEDLVLYF
ncbi:hypothetical protein TIFTF001_018360 [Ficus carica]|uniref:Ubiquitin-like protease family profile domain-containing protein n=1 Tax=Ficus carica TaxID=3494 RepID=A0AA88A9K9_FICCA|nr:hypothetical protein TIFTF001_018360 [Ficus carica]